MIHESVVLPLPDTVAMILLAAEFFSAQYHCATHMEIMGHVSLEGEEYAELLSWQHIVRVDQALGLLGLGCLEEDEPLDEQALLWVVPTGPGKLRLSPLSSSPPN
jgi:hypothetical protein